jgi:hypothetical protein
MTRSASVIFKGGPHTNSSDSNVFLTASFEVSPAANPRTEASYHSACQLVMLRCR